MKKFNFINTSISIPFSTLAKKALLHGCKCIITFAKYDYDGSFMHTCNILPSFSQSSDKIGSFSKGNTINVPYKELYHGQGWDPFKDICDDPFPFSNTRYFYTDDIISYDGTVSFASNKNEKEK